MKKLTLLLAIIGFSVATFGFGVTAQAESSLVGTVSSNSNSWRWCNTDFPFALYRGMRGEEVRELQQSLANQGFMSSANATGYFGPLTASAVAKMQAREGVVSMGGPGSGRMGPRTWRMFKRFCGGNPPPFTDGELKASVTSGAAPLPVTFYTNISGFRIATVWYEIDFGDGYSERAANCYAPADACIKSGENTHTYTSNGNYTAVLYKITDPCPDDGNPNTPRCLAAIQRESVGKVNINVGGPIACTMQYKPVCGAKQVTCIRAPCNPVPTTYGNECMMRADNASYLYEGACRTVTVDPASDPQCKSWYDGCNSCSRSTPNGPAMCTMMACMDNASTRPAPYCKEYFGTSGGAPSISSFSGPSNLAMNQTGTWSLQAQDPEGGNLSYSITWGDGNMYGATKSANSMYSVAQSTTFTHSYSVMGMYTVMITAKDDSGQQATATATVQIQ